MNSVLSKESPYVHWPFVQLLSCNSAP